ncbi:hypothetical protein [Myroides indicus]|uniref:hypothetical protein n=1 Tax=Myroides indicus TaxID=1323422 RepID=UPI00105F6EE6|nr:hypothetical protein [Myroides indicus]
MFLTSVFVFSSCSSDKDFSLEKKSNHSYKEKSIDLDFIGERHNRGLEYIYNEITEKGISFDIDSYSESYDKINTITENYFEYSNIDDTKEVYFFNKKDIDVFLNEKINFGVDAKHILKQYNLLFDNDDELDVTYRKMSNLNDELEFLYSNSLLFDKEYLILKSYMVTGLYSLQYWGQNIDNWILNIDRNIERKTNRNQIKSWDWNRFKRAVKNMAKADARGAGVGLVGGFVFGSAADPAGTVLGAAGGAVAMGMNGSAVAGVVELLMDILCLLNSLKIL